MNILWPHSMGSQGSKELANALQCRRVYSDRKYKYNKGDIVINWGNASSPKWAEGKEIIYLNEPSCVERAIHKLNCLTLLKDAGVDVIPFTTDIAVAQDWSDDGYSVFCRNLLTASGGRGITVAFELDQIVPAKMFTKGLVKKYDEFRVHVCNGRVFHIAMKRRLTKESADSRGIDPNRYIRNHDNGWVFATERVNDYIQPITLQTAARAIAVLNLDFGAVDILQHKEKAICRVLEINTAPGITGTTVSAYRDVIRDLCNRKIGK